MRADAKKNREQVLTVARAVITAQGADASLRDIARQAGVGLATVLRHFETREALLEALLRSHFDRLGQRAAELAGAASPREALQDWLRDCVACAGEFRGVTTLMMTAIQEPGSALHESCVAMRAAGTELLTRAQAAGQARSDLDGEDLFALIAALAWLSDQPLPASRADHLFDIVTSSILV